MPVECGVCLLSDKTSSHSLCPTENCASHIECIVKSVLVLQGDRWNRCPVCQNPLNFSEVFKHVTVINPQKNTRQKQLFDLTEAIKVIEKIKSLDIADGAKKISLLYLIEQYKDKDMAVLHTVIQAAGFTVAPDANSEELSKTLREEVKTIVEPPTPLDTTIPFLGKDLTFVEIWSKKEQMFTEEEELFSLKEILNYIDLILPVSEISDGNW